MPENNCTYNFKLGPGVGKGGWDGTATFVGIETCIFTTRFVKVMFLQASVIPSTGWVYIRGAGGWDTVGYYRTWSMSGRYASYWNAFLLLTISKLNSVRELKLYLLYFKNRGDSGPKLSQFHADFWKIWQN